MERITEWDDRYNNWTFSHSEYFVQDIVDRLAAYEDLGLTPDEIEAQLNTYSSLLCDITHGRMSKTNYALEDILHVYNDVQAEECDGCEEELRRRWANENIGGQT